MRTKHRSPANHHRESSVELGSPSRALRYNEQTGRPIRNTAGRRKSLPEYVDSVIIEEDIPVESCSSDDEGNPVQPRRATKRKRTPSPTPPPLEPIIRDDVLDGSDADDSTEDAKSGTVKTIVLNIPLGFHGPLVIKLDHGPKKPFDREKEEGLPNIWHPKPKSKRRTRTSGNGKNGDLDVDPNKVGFLSLPPELRNTIYRLLFVGKPAEFQFTDPDNFCRSSALLATCKQIHQEGRSILYGENKFVFIRDWRTRFALWDPVPKEVGYKDVRQFLKMIGPENLSLIREVRVVLEDARPASTPYLRSHEERRFLNDEHLIDCLRILRQASLQKLTLCFHGRRHVVDTDVRFLRALEQIQADEVCIAANPRWMYSELKLAGHLRGELIEAMTRWPRLY